MKKKRKRQLISGDGKKRIVVQAKGMKYAKAN
jgi:hypothetical protein